MGDSGDSLALAFSRPSYIVDDSGILGHNVLDSDQGSGSSSGTTIARMSGEVSPSSESSST